MAEAAAAAAASPLLGNLPDEIVLWEILVRLDPKSLLRCRAVRRAWRSATSTRGFLLAHHGRQPSLPILLGQGCDTILSLDHRAAADGQLHTVARLQEPFDVEASCDGLLVLSKFDHTTKSRSLSVCNPATREHAPLGLNRGFEIHGMYSHRPTGQCRLLLRRRGSSILACLLPQAQTGFYVFPLVSGQPPRYVGCSGTKLASAFFDVPAKLHDSLHWYPVYYPSEGEAPDYEADRELIIIFDTIAESFRQMRAPVLPTETESYIFEMDNTLGICSCNKAMEILDIWVLQNYGGEVWDFKYRIQLPMAEIKGKLEGRDGDGYRYLAVASGDGDVRLLVTLGLGRWLFYVDIDGKLLASFEYLYDCKRQLKETLVPHDFFTTRGGYAVDASPFINGC